MSKRAKLSLLLVALILVGAAAAVRSLLSHGFSARDEPTALEAFVARRLRHLAIPREAREAKNPVPLTPEVTEGGDGALRRREVRRFLEGEPEASEPSKHKH